MSDYAHEKTDEIIAELEKRMQSEYAQAAKEVEEKYNDYMQRYKVKDSIKRQQVAEGKITKKEYTKWRKGQICIGKRWEDLKDSLAQDMVNTNSIARSAIYEHTDEVYALNHNYATYQVEHDSMIDTSYTLYNRRAVEYLVAEDPTLLPYWEKPENKKKLEKIDKKWNTEKIGTSITQGILQGESIPQIGKRLETIVGMNKASSIRNARTIMTGTENKARQDAYDDLKEYGIDLEEQWIATLDSRTRSSHRWLHGTTKDPKTGEYENGLKYPGDPNGAAEEIYNCRCCEIATVLGHSIATPKYSPKLNGMSYEEWKNAKGKPKWAEPKVSASTLKTNYSANDLYKAIDDLPYEIYDALSEDVVDALYDKYEDQSFDHLVDVINGKEKASPEDEAIIKKYDLENLLAKNIAPEQKQNEIKISDIATQPKVKPEPKSNTKDDRFSEERKANAVRLGRNQKNVYDDMMREKTGKIWRESTADERYALYDYTSGSDGYNKPLRGMQAFYSEADMERTDAITRKISESRFEQDTWLVRGVRTGGAAKFLKIDEEYLINPNEETLRQLLVGKTVNDEAFLSCGSVSGAGFSGVRFNTYCPEGTQGIYCEPFSAFGLGGHSNWDGYSKQADYGSEFETLLQRDGEYEIQQVYVKDGKVEIDMDVVYQPDFFLPTKNECDDDGHFRPYNM